MKVLTDRGKLATGVIASSTLLVSTVNYYMDVGQNPVPPVNLKVDGHPLYHMISRFWPIPI